MSWQNHSLKRELKHIPTLQREYRKRGFNTKAELTGKTPLNFDNLKQKTPPTDLKKKNHIHF